MGSHQYAKKSNWSAGHMAPYKINKVNTMGLEHGGVSTSFVVISNICTELVAYCCAQSLTVKAAKHSLKGKRTRLASAGLILLQLWFAFVLSSVYFCNER